jgi:hypothetical protein
MISGACTASHLVALSNKGAVFFVSNNTTDTHSLKLKSSDKCKAIF